MFDVKTIAKNLVKYSNEINSPISNLKLQKLLYFTWIENYKKTGDYLFDDDFYAWQFGPVVPKIYYDYCAYGGMPITQEVYNALADYICPEVRNIIQSVVNRYKDYSALQLVNETHRAGHAWDYVYQDGRGNHRRMDFSDIIRLECK